MLPLSFSLRKSVVIPIAWYKAPCFSPKNRPGKEQRATPRFAPMQVWVALEQETFLGLSGPRLKRLLAPSLIDFREQTGIQALNQAIGIPRERLQDDPENDSSLGRTQSFSLFESLSLEP